LSNIALELQKHQMNIWYDKGIKRISEEEWQEQIALHIRDAEIVFFFISRGVFSKENSYVRKEYDVAKFWKKKICVVLLDKVEDSIIPAKYVFWWNEVLIVSRFFRKFNFNHRILGSWPADASAVSVLFISSIWNR
jgi:hypothetical protein